MPIKIISVGKKHEDWVADGIERYQSRLKRPFNAEWLIIPTSPLESSRALINESSDVYSHLNDNDFVILLDETGKNIDSIELSKLIKTRLDISKPVVFIIGGAYGVDENIKKRADFIWSLSKLVFPHQLVRLILSEQIYRAQEIAANHPYHHS